MCDEQQKYQTATIVVKYNAETYAEGFERLAEIVGAVDNGVDVEVTSARVNDNTITGNMYINTNGISYR